MMASLLSLAVSAGVPQRFAKPVVVAALAVLAIAAFFGAKALYDRSVIRDHEQKQEVKQARREEKADANLYRQKSADEAAARQRQQEIDDATRDIPDQAPSARQRARTCLELRRQGLDHPACGSVPAR